MIEGGGVDESCRSFHKMYAGNSCSDRSICDWLKMARWAFGECKAHQIEESEALIFDWVLRKVGER